MRILITGGAGFVGSHLADELLRHGHEVRVLDDLIAQVHEDRQRPAYLHADVELVRGDVRDTTIVRRALLGVDAVYHFAARVGVGQSMYQVAEYTSANTFGTAALLAEVIERPVERFVVASSMSLYGEGLYVDHRGAVVTDADRTPEQLKLGHWDPMGPERQPLQPVPTPESKPPRLASVYALSKFDQERLALLVGQAYNIPTVALRFFNIYGTRQALSNPYTGVLAIFAARLLNGRAPLLFEDGQQRRDFVSVHDIVQACRLALEQPADAVAGRAFNVGSGDSRTVVDVAHLLARTLGVDVEPEVTGKYRVGDIRHCFADLTLARTVLGYTPRVRLEDGLRELAGWLADQPADDRAQLAHRELERRGLTA
jgi:dTDP-L-rhamnose 4-epimerase